jgi:hypothetical protein
MTRLAKFANVPQAPESRPSLRGPSGWDG